MNQDTATDGGDSAPRKKTMKTLKRDGSVAAAAPAPRHKTEIVCSTEHIPDSSTRETVPVHSPSLTSSPSGDIASSEVSLIFLKIIFCIEILFGSWVGIKICSSCLFSRIDFPRHSL